MFSERLRRALADEVVGQPRAIESVVRSATRLVSGLTPLERCWSAQLFLGPPGTGRAHLVRTLARHLHGAEMAYTVSCNPAGHADPWSCFVQQLAPLFASQVTSPLPGSDEPPRIVLVQDVERAHKSLFPQLARFLETGQLTLPDGRVGKLRNCMVFLLSGLCTERILETGGIGFAGSAPVDEGPGLPEQLVETCTEEAKQTFGLELVAQMDEVVIFGKLETEHLERILAGHFARVGRWMAARGVECELLPAASAFLLERGAQQRLLGARDLISIHRREVEFPIGDLLVSGELARGSRVVVDHVEGEEHLDFTVLAPEVPAGPSSRAVEIPVLG